MRALKPCASHLSVSGMNVMDMISDAQADCRTAPNAAQMLDNAKQTAAFLRSLSHPSRLVILCRLAEGPARVNELETALEIPQTAVSKQLARLREEGLVTATRDGRSIVYSLHDERALRVLQVLYEEFCK